LNLLYPAYARDWPGGRHHQAMLDAAGRRDAAALTTALVADLAAGRRQLEPMLPDSH
jgi:DNA-binding GntR family transcriptional regulator